MRRDQFLHLLDHGAAAALGALAVHQHRQRIDRLVVDQDLHLDEIGRLVVGEMIVERGITLGNRLQPVVEIEHHFVERQFVFHHGAIADVSELFLRTATVLAQF